MMENKNWISFNDVYPECGNKIEVLISTNPKREASDILSAHYPEGDENVEKLKAQVGDDGGLYANGSKTYLPVDSMICWKLIQ